MNGTTVPQTFSDFASSTTPDMGPVETTNIERKRYKRVAGERGGKRRKRRRMRRAT